MKEIQKSAISSPEENLHKSKVQIFLSHIYILYRTPELRRRSLLMYFVFMVASTVFFGLNLSATNFKLDPYMYVIVSGAVEIPVYSFTAPIVRKLGRVPPTISVYLICGVTLIMLAFIQDLKWLTYTLAMIAKLLISSGFQIIYLISSEIFPTEVRLQAVGTSNFVSTAGSVFSPYIIDLIGPIYPWLPSVIFGILSLCGGIAAFYIPETNNRHTPETIVQLEEESKQEKKSMKMKTKNSKEATARVNEDATNPVFEEATVPVQKEAKIPVQKEATTPVIKEATVPVFT